MKKTEIDEKTQAVVDETKEVLETLIAEINKGQWKQLVKKENIKKLFDRYGVEYESEG